MTAAALRRQAREALRGHWGIAVLVTFVALLLGGTYGSFDTDYTTQIGGDTSGEYVYSTDEDFYEIMPGAPVIQQSPILELKIRPAWLGLLISMLRPLVSVILIYNIVVFLIGGAVELGLASYFMNLHLGREQQPFRTLFSHFNNFGWALGLRLLTWALIFLWSLLLVIPGIIAAYRYAMAPYLMAQDPEVGPLEAIQRSKELMDGHKLRLFCLELSFIGWAILSALTLGFGSFLLNPYVEAARSAFYLELTGQITVEV